MSQTSDVTARAKNYKSPEELTIRTDDEILEDFREGSPLTKKIAKRLTSRKAYDSLPFQIHVYQDLPANVKQLWEDLLILDREAARAPKN